MHINNKKQNGFVQSLSQRNPILVTIIIALSIISFYTSYDGFLILSGGQLSKPLLLVLVSTIQLILVFALFSMIEINYIILRLLWLFIYIVVMFVSVFFSYSFYYGFIRAEGFAEQNAMSQARQIANTFQGFENAFNNIHSTVIELSDYSSKTAQREREYGGTCDPSVGAGNGPRRYFRDEEAKLFDSFVSDINELQNKIRQDISMIKSEMDNYSTETVLESQEKMNQRISLVNFYKEDVILKEIEQAVKAHTGDNRFGVQSLDPKNNQPAIIDCPDATFDRKAKLIISSLNRLKPIEWVEFFNPNDEKERVERAFAVFVTLPSIIQGEYQLNDENNDPNRISQSDITPVIIGYFVDFLIFFIGLADGMTNKKKNKPIDHNYEGEVFGVQSINAMRKYLDKSPVETVFGKFSRYLHSSFSSVLFFLPTEDADSDEQKLLDLFVVLEAIQGVKHFMGNLPAHKLPRALKKRLSIGKGDPRTFDVFKMPKKAWRELILAEYVVENK
ncbi:hypothetical protein PN36_10160 [Candidatus Thiomargarita nelsonii]|uniref:Uncharacterized protein n=1 Tax=Candidatus Thiomargarita nelsonii TaxID=1003181 RepID=A0A0A6PLM5_9GAMM|nr:hypothetical protein PN36_10160 [Candidatus Thiomargarita nelsonii]